MKITEGNSNTVFAFCHTMHDATSKAQCWSVLLSSRGEIMFLRKLSRRMLERSVRRGAAYLDKVKPGWDSHIDTDNFCIGTYDRCVLGQLHPGGYQEGIAALRLSPWEASRCGFDLLPLARWPSWRLVGSRTGFDTLNECWRELIRSRRQVA